LQAFWYEPDGYVTELLHMGRQTAGSAFLREAIAGKALEIPQIGHTFGRLLTNPQEAP